MIALEAWRKFAAHWPKLALAGVFTILVYGLVIFVAGLIILPLTGLTIWSTAQMTAGGDLSGFDQVIALGATLLLAVLIAGAALVVVGPLAQGGLIHSVVQAQRDQPADAAGFWRAGARYWGRLLVYSLILVVVSVVLGICGLILGIIPILGHLVWALGAAVIWLAVGGYGPYLIVAENLSPGAALGKSLQILSRRFLDLLLTVLLFIGAWLLLGLALTVINRIPGVGLPLTLIVEVLVAPFAVLYLAVRYQTNIAPVFSLGGGSSFHPSPPPSP